MINKEQLLLELDQSTTNLIQQINACRDEDFNRNPGENCWSQAQVAEHILLLETMVNQVLQKADATERSFDLKVEPLKKAMASFERKYNAPDFIIPTSVHKEKQQLIEALTGQRTLLKRIIAATDLTQTATYKHPVIGDMTRLEWIHFNISHSERHVKQMKNISEQLAQE